MHEQEGTESAQEPHYPDQGDAGVSPQHPAARRRRRRDAQGCAVRAQGDDQHRHQGSGRVMKTVETSTCRWELSPSSTLVRNGVQLVSDIHDLNPSINDPLRGGLCGFGLVACRPSTIDGPDPDNFWNETWELTHRTLADVKEIPSADGPHFSG